MTLLSARKAARKVVLDGDSNAGKATSYYVSSSAIPSNNSSSANQFGMDLFGARRAARKVIRDGDSNAGKATSYYTSSAIPSNTNSNSAHNPLPQYPAPKTTGAPTTTSYVTAAPSGPQDPVPVDLTSYTLAESVQVKNTTDESKIAALNQPSQKSTGSSMPDLSTQATVKGMSYSTRKATVKIPFFSSTRKENFLHGPNGIISCQQVLYEEHTLTNFLQTNFPDWTELKIHFYLDHSLSTNDPQEKEKADVDFQRLFKASLQVAHSHSFVITVEYTRTTDDGFLVNLNVVVPLVDKERVRIIDLFKEVHAKHGRKLKLSIV